MKKILPHHNNLLFFLLLLNLHTTLGAPAQYCFFFYKYKSCVVISTIITKQPSFSYTYIQQVMIRILFRLFIFLFTYSQTVIPPVVSALRKLHGRSGENVFAGGRIAGRPSSKVNGGYQHDRNHPLK